MAHDFRETPQRHEACLPEATRLMMMTRKRPILASRVSNTVVYLRNLDHKSLGV
jgi:hypothetical protein